MKFIASIVILAALSGCSGSPDATGSSAGALTQDSALTACSATNGDTCVVVPNCQGNGAVCTFGGNSQTGVPMHVDELDCWVYSGPLAGETAKAVTGGGMYAAYACGTPGGAGYPGATLVATGTW